MKVLILISLFITGCLTTKDIALPFESSNRINDSNYMKTPCLIDGAIVKKKPKINNQNGND